MLLVNNVEIMATGGQGMTGGCLHSIPSIMRHVLHVRSVDTHPF